MTEEQAKQAELEQEQAKEEPEGFLFDDYFDTGETTKFEVVHGGRILTFELKRHTSIRERKKAATRATVLHFDPAGKPVIDSFDEVSFTIDTVLNALVSWPFTYKNGKSVPIERWSVEKLDPTIMDAISNFVLGVKQEQIAQLLPFGKVSADHS